MTARTQDEILARYRSITNADDFLGFRREALASLMTADTINTVGDFQPVTEPVTPPDPMARLTGYLTFAFEKAANHRGISASRSVDKLSEYAWAAGRDDAVAAMEEADYTNYGVPKLRALCVTIGNLAWTDDLRLNRMSHGLPCEPGCEEGCGQ